MIANSFVLYTYIKCFLSVLWVLYFCDCSGSLRIWVKSSSTRGNLAGAVWSNLSHSFSFFWDKILWIGDKKNKDGNWEFDGDEWEVQTWSRCWIMWSVLVRRFKTCWSVLVHQGSRHVPLQVSASPSKSRRTGSVSPEQTIRRFSRTLKLPLVLFTLAFCTCQRPLNTTALRMNAVSVAGLCHSTHLSQGRVGQSYWPRPEKTNISLHHVLCGFFPAHDIQKPVSGPTCTWDLSTGKCTHNKLLV